MAFELGESSRSSARQEEAAEGEASSGAAARQQPPPWVALSSIPAVYRPRNPAAAAFVPDVDLLLELQPPPLGSYLALPERLVPDPRRWEPGYNFPYVIAAAPGRLLFMASQMATQRRSVNDPDYFLCDVAARTALRLPAVPREFPFGLFPRRTMGLAADPRFPGQDQYMLAQLHPAEGSAQRRHDALLCFSTATGQWSVKYLASAPDHDPWGAHGVFALGGFLWWVDVAYGMLFCDPSEENPRLRLVTLPDGCQMQGLGNGRPRDTRLMDQRRLVRPSQGMLRYVEIQGLSYDPAAVNEPPNNPAVAMWTLVEPEGADPWRHEFETSFTDIWDHPTYINAGLPQGMVPKLALIDPTNHEVVYFFQDALLFAWDARAGEVVRSEECFVDRDYRDPFFQYSRFVDAWYSELAPTLHGDDPASSDGGSGSGSDEELASLLSQMEIRSQPDREHSLSDLLVMIEEDMAPPAEPSPEAKMGDQADEP
ncbi:unnamed protein product [Urochloa decumbens]|uniref:DUF1618 domain-containing protein n=1 Tax=Urochloa decumbens TaxID=240449 RepID=A0ABC9BKE3_9POAL